MAKPKASTLQARFGFLDDDLKTSSHDAIMEWLDANSRELTQKILKWEAEWNKDFVQNNHKKAEIAVKNQIAEWLASDFERDKEYVDELKSWAGLDAPPEKPPLDIQLVWEYTVSTNNKFVVGFIDMKLVVHDSSLVFWGVKYDQYLEKYMLESHLRSKKPYFLPSWHIEPRSKRTALYFEVKSTLPSLGELIRQIRMYQEYVKGDFYVVAPDDKYAEQLVKQGIGFIKYPEGKLWRVE